MHKLMHFTAGVAVGALAYGLDQNADCRDRSVDTAADNLG